MIPTNKIRWAIKKREVTAEQIRKLADEWELSISQAKFELQNKRGPVLQQWWEERYYVPAHLEDAPGEWRDVECEVIWD